MSKDFDRSTIDTYHQLDKNYELLLQRMKRFDDQIDVWSVPSATLTIFVKELKGYLTLLSAELKETDVRIASLSKPSTTQSSSDALAIGQLKLTKKKLLLTKAQLANVYERWKWAKKTTSEEKKKNATHSAIRLWQYKQLSKKFMTLYNTYQILNKKHISVELDDTYEAEIEKDDNFLLLEVDYLTNLTNMLSKIHQTHLTKKALCSWGLEELKKTWRTSWTQDHYTIVWDIHQSDFKKDYDHRVRDRGGRRSRKTQRTLVIRTHEARTYATIQL